MDATLDVPEADVLGDGPGLRYDEDVFQRHDRSGGQLIGDLDGHISLHIQEERACPCHTRVEPLSLP